MLSYSPQHCHASLQIIRVQECVTFLLADAEAHIALRDCCRATRLLADLKTNPIALISPPFSPFADTQNNRRRLHPVVSVSPCSFCRGEERDAKGGGGDTPKFIHYANLLPTVTHRGRCGCERGGQRAGFKMTRMRS